MTKLIYAAYLLLTTAGLIIVVHFSWNLLFHRRLAWKPLLGLVTVLGAMGGIYLWEEHRSYASVAADRAAEIARLDAPIYVATVWPEDEPSFFRGAELAVRQLNEQGGVVVRAPDGNEAKRKIELIEVKTSHDGDDAYRDLARDRRLAAVIGHRESHDASKAAIAYDESGLLFVVPTVTIPALTKHAFSRVIRTVPDDSVVAEQMAAMMHARGLNRVAILFARRFQGETLARYVMQAMNSNDGASHRADDMTIVLTRSYPLERTHFEELITELVERRPDVIVVGDLLPRAAHLIRQIRQRGLEQPIFAAPALEDGRLFTIAGRYSDDVYVPSLFASEKQARLVDDSFAGAQAYDAVRLLAKAWERTGSTHPSSVAATLRALPAWEGMRGSYNFTRNGDVRGWQLLFKRSQDGRFIEDSAATRPRVEATDKARG